MKRIKFVVFSLFFLPFSNFTVAQKKLIFSQIPKIQQEVSFVSETFSKNFSKERKMPNGQKVVFNNTGGSKERKYFRLSEVTTKVSEDKIALTVKTKRIKNEAYSIEIDTDVPFANNPQTQATLDNYLAQLGQIKYMISTEKMRSVQPIEETVWNGPLLNPIHELSGIFYSNEFLDLQKGMIRQDTIKGIFNSYINKYEVLDIIADYATISITGILEKLIPQKLENDDSLDVDKMVRSGEKIETKIIINSAQYEGKMTVNTKNMMIEDMTLKINREETKSIFGNTLPQALKIDLTVKNKPSNSK